MLLNEKFCKLVYLFGVMLKVNWSHIVLSPVLYLVAKKIKLIAVDALKRE